MSFSLKVRKLKKKIFSQVISYDSPRGGISVITEKAEITTSYLLIQNADLADSGKYTCAPSNAGKSINDFYWMNGNGRGCTKNIFLHWRCSKCIVG